jgi:hypothetical protein
VEGEALEELPEEQAALEGPPEDISFYASSIFLLLAHF